MFAKRRTEPYVTPVNSSPVSAKDMPRSEFRQESSSDLLLFYLLLFNFLTSLLCLLNVVLSLM